MNLNESSLSVASVLEYFFDDLTSISGVISGKDYPGLDGFRIMPPPGVYTCAETGRTSTKAITVVAPDGRVFVHFNGTGAGNWKYNADSAFGTEPSAMQQWAANHFDEMIGKLKSGGVSLDALFVTGHSQGGNNAQFASLFSENNGYIYQVIALDAPGFNDATYQLVREKWGNQWDGAVERIFGVNGENDYVHVLGERHIILGENTFYIQTPGASDPYGFHDISTRLILDENGRPLLDEYGNPRLHDWGERGPFADFFVELNETLIRHLPPDQRHRAGEVIMSLAEWVIGDGSLPDWSWSDTGNVLMAFRDILFVITRTGLENPDILINMILELCRDNPWLAVGLIALLPLMLPFVIGTVTVAVILHVIDSIIRALPDIINATGGFFVSVGNFLLETFNAFRNSVERLVQWISNAWNARGRNYAAANPHIMVNTVQLRNHANRVQAVNNRIGNLDSSMRFLWHDVRLRDLPNLFAANLMTAQSPTLNRVRDYLNNAAIEFENADNKARGYMGG